MTYSITTRPTVVMQAKCRNEKEFLLVLLTYSPRWPMVAEKIPSSF